MKSTIIALILTLFPLLTTAACTPVQPVAKLGLIAPFEGLYRESGYGMLDAVRNAIEDCTPEGVSVIPLALDDSARPETSPRTIEKLLADQALMAIIGPASLETIAAASSAMPTDSPVWISPTAIDSSGQFASPGEAASWLDDFITESVILIAEHGAATVFISGIPEVWGGAVRDRVKRAEHPIPVEFIAADEQALNGLGADSALLWLGPPHRGAEIATAMHKLQSEAVFWMGPQGEDTVFAAHYEGSGPLYWVSWVTPQYNADLQRLASGALMNELTYSAACTALSVFYGNGVELHPLTLMAFRLETDGTSTPLSASQ